MCDISAVRNWLIALLAMIGAAVTSSLFALWATSLPAYLRWLAPASFATAAALAIGAAAMAIAAGNALNSFCSCTGNIAACAGPCAALKRDLSFVAGVLSIQAWLNIFSTIPAMAEALAIALVALAIMAFAVVIAGLISAGNLASCQPAR
jgi:hypothetical protein